MMFSETRGPPPPPPPPWRRLPRRLRREISIVSFTRDDFRVRPRYRCCWKRLHLKAASFVIAAIDVIAMTVAFARGVHVGRSMQHNPMAVSWFVASSLIFVLGIFCTLSMMYGLYRERYLWMLPMLVCKAFSVVVCAATTVAFGYMMIGYNQYLLDLVAEHVTRFDYETARTALRFGGGALVVGFALMALVQVWFLRVLYRCYKYVKDKYFWLICHPEETICPVEPECAQSVHDLNIGHPSPRRSALRLINGHGGGPTASVSNSTALTDVEPLPLTSPISSPSSSKLLALSEESTEQDLNNCYAPIVTHLNSDREGLWRTFHHANI